MFSDQNIMKKETGYFLGGEKKNNTVEGNAREKLLYCSSPVFIVLIVGRGSNVRF